MKIYSGLKGDSIYINREFANGSIYHKKLEMVYDVDDYNLYHFEKLGGLERIYKVCLPYPKDTLVNTKIIQGNIYLNYLLLYSKFR